MQEATTVLSQLCKVVTSIGLVVVVFGQAYSHCLLYLYGGSVLIEDLPVMLLRCHCLAVLLLAVNGVTECYVFATMDNTQLDRYLLKILLCKFNFDCFRYNYVMVIFSFMFLILSYVFTTLIGPVGFILANCINMFARICHR